MATVNKDFKIKSGLIVEGTTATVNGYDVLTKKQDDQDYIVGLIGGTATSANTANAVVKRDASGNFAAGTITANLTGQVSDISNHDTDDLSEGTSNKYFTNQRALDATSAAYDAAGTAATEAGYVASDLSDHMSDTSAHGVTGNVVGTSDTQTLTNKTIGDTLNFTGAGAMTINSDSHIVLTPAAGSSVKWGSDVLATENYVDGEISTGDTMTGDLVLPGAPTLNLHAATKGYVDGEISTLDTAAQGYADTAEGNANDYTDSAISTEVSNRNDAISSAISTEITNRNNAISTAKGEAISSANSYADGVGTAANGYTDGAIGTEVANRNDAITNAISTEVTNRNNAITSAVDALSTNDIEEGSNLYFTDVRAKTSAADLLTGASLTNITITGTGAGLTITAENGVADSDTDDLTEGATNLYFTAQRAVDALEAVVPNFTSVELNSVAKQVAATLSAPTAGIQVAHGFLKADWRSAEYLVKVAYGSHTEISKVLLTLDTSDNIAITEYGIVGTNGSASSISAGVSGDTVQLQVTTANNNSTVTVVGTLLA